MLLHDTVANTESQPCAFANVFGGVEGIENLAGLFDSRPGILKFREHIAIFCGHANFQAAALPGFQHGVDGIIDDVEEYLLELMRVGGHGRKVGVNLLLQLYVIYPQIVVTQREGFLENFANVYLLFLRLALPGKRKQVLHYPMRPLSLLEELSDEIGGALAEAFAFEQLGVAENRRQRVVQLVSDAGDQLADGRHLLTLQ